MASPISISPAVQPPAQLTLVASQAPKVDAAFLDRRMREHRQWQQRIAEDTTREIVAEVRSAVECEIGYGPAKIMRLP